MLGGSTFTINKPISEKHSCTEDFSMSSLRSNSNGNDAGAGAGAANTGIRSIREMFEKGGGSGASNASMSPRGLSPADSANGGERPMRKVRTSFVSVEPSGTVDVGNADAGAAVNGRGREVGGKADNAGTNGEATGTKQIATNPKLKAELDQIVAKMAANGTGEQKRSSDVSVNGGGPRIKADLVDEKKESGSPSPADRVHKPSPPIGDSLNGKDVAKTSTKQPAASEKASPAKSSSAKINGINKTNEKDETLHKSPTSTPKRSKAASLAKMTDAAPSPRNVALPTSPNSPKSVAKSASNPQDSPTKNKRSSTANAKSRISSTGGTAKASGSSSNKQTTKPSTTEKDGAGTVKKDASSTRKLSVNSAGSQKVANSKEKRTSLPQAPGTAAKLANTSGPARASIGAASATGHKKTEPAKISTSQPSLKSPKRASTLSTHLTAPTASSSAKHGPQSPNSHQQSLGSSTSTIGRKPSTMSRDKNPGFARSTMASTTARKAPSAGTAGAGASSSSTSASHSAKPASNIKKTTNTSNTAAEPKTRSSRASLPAMSSKNTHKTASSKAGSSAKTANTSTTSGPARSNSVRSPGNSFLDRMMRPTASFASKTHDKVDVKSSPPPRRSALVRTRAKPALSGTDKGASAGGGGGGAATDTGPVSRTRALQDALIGSKGRKQGGVATSRKAAPATSTDSPVKKDGAVADEKENDEKGGGSDDVGSASVEPSDDLPVTTKQDEREASASPKQAEKALNGDVLDSDKKISQSGTTEKTTPVKTIVENSADMPNSKPGPESKPEYSAKDIKAKGEKGEEVQINGEGTTRSESTASVDGGKDGGNDSTPDAKPGIGQVEQVKSAEQDRLVVAEEADGPNTSTVSVSTDTTDTTAADLIVVPTPQFDRTVIR